MGGPGASIALGIGNVVVDNDVEGLFLSPCPVFSECVYFKVCNVVNWISVWSIT